MGSIFEIWRGELIIGRAFLVGGGGRLFTSPRGHTEVHLWLQASGP